MTARLSAPRRRRAGGHAARPRVRIGQLEVDRLGFDDALERIAELVEAGTGGAVFTPNVDHVVKAERDAAFRDAYHRAKLSLADGMPLLWAARALGSPLPEKVSGSDLVRPLMRLAADRDWRVFLLGGAPGVAAEAARRLVAETGVEIVGVEAPVVSDDGTCEDAPAVVSRLKAAEPHIVLVALGAPKQELWIDASSAQLAPAVAIGVGGSLDFVAGRARRAPAWMSRAGLEWLFRLGQDPRRLWRRYLVEDPAFLAIVVRGLRHEAEAHR